MLACAALFVYNRGIKQKEGFFMTKITGEMSIAEILRLDPEVAPVFLSYGMHCLHCPVSSAEPLKDACMVHGVDADELLTALNEYFSEKEK